MAHTTASLARKTALSQWYLFLFTAAVEILMGLTLFENKGLLPIKKYISVEAPAEGVLEERLEELRWHIPDLVKSILSLHPFLLALFLTSMVFGLWVLGRIALHKSLRRGWSWPVLVLACAGLLLYNARSKLVRNTAALEQFAARWNDKGVEQVRRSITFVEDITPVLSLFAILLAMELLVTLVSAGTELQLGQIFLPVCLLCWWGLMLQTVVGGVEAATRFFKFMVIGMFVCALATLLGSLRLTERMATLSCRWMMGIAVFTCILGNLQPVNGSGAWIRLGGLSFQTGEVFKCFVVVFAAYAYPLMKANKALNSLFYRTCAVMGATLVLENDCGNLLVLGILVVIVAALDDYLVGAALFTSVVVGIPRLLQLASFLGKLKGFPLSDQLARISGRFEAMMTVLEQPSSVPTFRTSLLAMLKGGMLGTGVAESRSTCFHSYAAGTDFAFTSIHAIWGLGAGLSVLLCFLLILHTTNVPYCYARRSESYLAGRLAAAVLAVQFLIHSGAALNLLPFTGTNLPFVSGGGTSMLTSWGLMGIAMSAQLNDRAAAVLYRLGDGIGRLVTAMVRRAAVVGGGHSARS